jgi:uncharacterized protein YcbK (DUF882 family)
MTEEGDGLLTIYNAHSHEFETIEYKGIDGNYKLDGVSEINRLMRCRLTNETKIMSLRLIELLDHIQDHFGAAEIEIVSGYRSPRLNAALRAKSRRVASKSLHMQGLAADIKIPGVPLKEIRQYALSLGAGGVGYYPGKFIHVDVGPVRKW